MSVSGTVWDHWCGRTVPPCTTLQAQEMCPPLRSPLSVLAGAPGHERRKAGLEDGLILASVGRGLEPTANSAAAALIQVL